MKLTIASSSDVCTHWPATGAIARDQRGQHPLREHRAGGGVGDRDADAPRSRARRAGDAHQPAEALRDLVDARVGRRTGRPDRSPRCTRRPPAGSPPTPRRGRCASRCFTAGRKFSTTTSARSTRRNSTARPSSVARSTITERLLRWRLAPSDRRCDENAPLRRSAPHDVGAEVGELAHARRARPRQGEVDHADAGERPVFHLSARGERRDPGDHHDEAEHQEGDGAADRRLRELALRARVRRARTGLPGRARATVVAPTRSASRGRRSSAQRLPKNSAAPIAAISSRRTSS